MTMVETRRVLTTEDRLAILELLARYGNAVDDRDWDSFDDLFTEDAMFTIRGFSGVSGNHLGRSAIVEMMRVNVRHPIAHHVTNVVIEVDCDQVLLRSKILGTGPNGRVGSADCRDELVRTVDGWRIASRDVVLRRAH